MGSRDPLRGDRVLTSTGWLRRLTLAAAALSGCGSLALVFWALRSWDVETGDLVTGWPLWLLVASPFVALAALALWLGRRPVPAGILLVGTLGIGACGLLGLYDAFIARPTMLSGLVLLGVAGAQWWAVAAVGLLAGLARALLRRRDGAT